MTTEGQWAEVRACGFIAAIREMTGAPEPTISESFYGRGWIVAWRNEHGVFAQVVAYDHGCVEWYATHGADCWFSRDDKIPPPRFVELLREVYS